VHLAGGGIELVVGVEEAEFREQAAGGVVLGVMPGEDGLGAKGVEGVGEDELGRLGGKTFAPEGGEEVDAELEGAGCRGVRA
jgi:hypothetical protein